MKIFKMMARNARNNATNPMARGIYLRSYLWADVLLIAGVVLAVWYLVS